MLMEETIIDKKDPKFNKNSEIEYFLGVDWGAKKTGLALVESETKIATGLKEVKSEKLLQMIEELNDRYFFSGVVVGKASHKAFEDNRNIDIFIKDLAKLDLNVELEEEFFSTKLAQQNLIQAQKKKISQNDNVEAARIILQDWMDKKSQRC